MKHKVALLLLSIVFVLMSLHDGHSKKKMTHPLWKVDASSYEVGAIPSRSPQSAFDGLFTTFWSEGEIGSGIGSFIEVDFGSPIYIDEIEVFHGNFIGNENFNSYNRLKSVKLIVFDGNEEKEIPWEMNDVFYPQRLKLKGMVQRIRFLIEDVWTGAVYSDTVISEIVFTDGKGDNEQKKKFRTISEKKEYQKKLENHQNALLKAFEGCKKGEHYVENLEVIGKALVDGPSFVYEMIKDVIPPGFRFNLISCDRKAAEYIEELKDATMIRYIQAAKFREEGERSEFGRDLNNLEKYFESYKLLQREWATIEPWGVTGIEMGALQGKGEPLSISVDSLGYIYVADTANHRIQKFDPNGKAVDVWGKKGKTINYIWFGQPSEAYASGCSPGKGPGEFENPIYISLNYDDVVAVIDSTKRVQFFTPEGKFLRGWEVPYKRNIDFGVGNNNPILCWLDRRYIYIFIGNMAYLYDFKNGKLKTQFEIKDGDVRGATIFKKKIYFKFDENKLIQYDLKGWRAGTFITIDDGSEDWDIQSEDDFIYIMTDEFKLYKYDKKGTQVKVSELFNAPEIAPFRFTIFEDVIFFTYKDSIKRVVNK